MNIQDILILYDYNYWANARILAGGARVSAEQFAAPGAFPFSGLRGTLVHILDTEQGWRTLFQRKSRSGIPELKEADLLTRDLLVSRWREEEAVMRTYLAGLSDDDLNGHLRYTADDGGMRDRLLWHCLVHVVNHGTQHRSEAALLTGFGCSPGDLDFTVFMNQYQSPG